MAFLCGPNSSAQIRCVAHQASLSLRKLIKRFIFPARRFSLFFRHLFLLVLVMVLGTDVRDRAGEVDFSHKLHRFTFPCEGVPYLLATADAFVIVVACIVAGETYHWLIYSALPYPVVYATVGLLASLIHVLRLSVTGYYDFQSGAKPHVELEDIPVS